MAMRMRAPATWLYWKSRLCVVSPETAVKAAIVADGKNRET
jgi:hypothetical protein